jgi:hypothetical protein
MAICFVEEPFFRGNIGMRPSFAGKWHVGRRGTHWGNLAEDEVRAVLR